MYKFPSAAYSGYDPAPGFGALEVKPAIVIQTLSAGTTWTDSDMIFFSSFGSEEPQDLLL